MQHYPVGISDGGSGKSWSCLLYTSVLEIDGSSQVLFEKKLTDKFARGLGNALETLNVEEIENTVKYIQKEALTASGVHGWEIEELVWQCGNIFILRMDFPDKKDQQRNFLAGCGRCMTVEEDVYKRQVQRSSKKIILRLKLLFLQRLMMMSLYTVR